jgi:hypothetical protein
MSEYDTAPAKRKVFGKLPVNRETAAQMIDVYIAPLIERAGMTVKITKTQNTRTLKITLPTK